MTYIAAQKGWDGVALVVLMLLSWVLRLRFTDDSLARAWQVSEGITVEAASFEFTGRTIIIGAVQAFSGSKRTIWVDDIVAPHPRRQAWLRRLEIGDAAGSDNLQGAEFEELDLKAIEITLGLAQLGSEIMKKEVGGPIVGLEGVCVDEA